MYEMTMNYRIKAGSNTRDKVKQRETVTKCATAHIQKKINNLHKRASSTVSVVIYDA